MYRRVCAIDVGYRNFAYCIVDTNNWREPLYWRNFELWPHDFKPNLDDIVGVTVTWCRQNKGMLDACDTIVLERQMRDRFQVMNAVIHALFFGKVRTVNPQSLGAYYRLPKKRAAKKVGGVDYAKRNGVLFPVADKLDDYADAWLMATWQLFDGGVDPRD